MTHLIHLYRKMRAVAASILNRGNQRACPVCEKSFRTFQTSGREKRREGRCYFCGALERHRLLWIYLHQQVDFTARPLRLLHIAPEPCFVRRFRTMLGDQYLTADLCNPDVDVKMDITDIPNEAESFDAVLCNHVLEHVSDDQRALSEIYRVLTPGGWAVLMVPIRGTTTKEDPEVTSPEMREKLYGQRDHVRQYGSDYPERLRHAVGFDVHPFAKEDLLTADDIIRFGLSSIHDKVFVCHKPIPPHHA